MHLPDVLRRINRRVTNPILGLVAWLLPPLAIVCHPGRKSGRPYRTPVVAFGGSAGFVLPLTYGRDVDWAQNLIAAGGGELIQMGRRFRLRNARIVGGDEARARLPWLARPLLAANLPGYVLLDF